MRVGQRLRMAYTNNAVIYSRTADCHPAAADPFPIEETTDEPFLSACLLYMDDNHRLPEWLAYHYYNMNLRHVVINIDFRSLTELPNEILERWRPFVSSEIWHPKDWMDPASRYESALNAVRNNVTFDNGWQVDTQNLFNRRCALHHKSLNRTWVSFIDTDEFWLLNPAKVPDSIHRMAQPGSVLTYITGGQADLATLDANTSAPQLPERYRGPCVSTHRINFGGKESTELALRRQVPDWIDPVLLETMRWRHHAGEDYRLNGKVMIDVSRVDTANISDPDQFAYPHRLMDMCPLTWVDFDSHLRIHHYFGSWEYFNYRRADSRYDENRARYNETLETLERSESHASDDIRPWLIGFVRHVGEETARELLKDQGILQEQGTVPIGILLAKAERNSSDMEYS